MSETIVEWFGSGSPSSCGYCKSEDTSVTHGMWAHRMSCQVYQNLLDRGWRRSGAYCYKPTMDKTCCPQYTIRCDVTQIKMTKSQKKVLKNVNKYLVSGVKGSVPDTSAPVVESSGEDKVCQQQPAVTLNEQDLVGVSNLVESSNDCQSVTDTNASGEQCVDSEAIISATGAVEVESSEKTISAPVVPTQKSVAGPDPNKPPCRKAKDIRKERRLLKLSKKDSESGSSNPIVKPTKPGGNGEKTIENFIDDIPSETKHTLKLTLVNVKDKRLFETTADEEFALYCKYQHIIHGDDEDELTERQFRRFLVDGPLQYQPPVANSTEIPPTGLGAFHQQYRLDGKLIAVGVIDILPHLVSSKYFFYDPDYRFLNLGTYSALREIYFIRQLHKSCPNMRFYYMGFYIDSCIKMKYKGKYWPSYLLCPETYIWQPIERCIPKFAVSKYSRLEEDIAVKAPPAPDLNGALVLNDMSMMTVKDYLKKTSSKSRKAQLQEIMEYTMVIGPACHQIMLYRH